MAARFRDKIMRFRPLRPYILDIGFDGHAILFRFG